MTITVGTLTAELIDAVHPPRILLKFGSSPITEWQVPEWDYEQVTATATSKQPSDDEIRVYVESFMAGKLAELFKGSRS